MPAPFDPDWLFRYESLACDALAQRLDVAGLPRWSNPELADCRDANHAAVPVGAGLIPDQLVQVLDAQRRDGATRPCVDLYGAADERDALLQSYGLSRECTAPLVLIAYFRDQTPAPLHATDVERTAPPASQLGPAEWVDAVSASRGARLPAGELAVLRAQAAMENARFFAIAIGDTTVATLARFDWPGASQLACQYTHPDFRKTGFAKALVERATYGAPARVVFALVEAENAAVLRVARRSGGDPVAYDVRRRYVGDWATIA